MGGLFSGGIWTVSYRDPDLPFRECANRGVMSRLSEMGQLSRPLDANCEQPWKRSVQATEPASWACRVFKEYVPISMDVAALAFSAPTPFAPGQPGNGARLVSPNSAIRSRTLSLLPTSWQTSLSSASRWPPYHSGGISFAMLHIFSGSIDSIRPNHGSKLCQPVTFLYTECRA